MTVLSDSEYSGEMIHRRLDRLGLKDAFSGVISSIDLGHTKPEPQCYQAALDAIQVMGGDGVTPFYPLSAIMKVAKVENIAAAATEKTCGDHRRVAIGRVSRSRPFWLRPIDDP